MIGGRRIRRTRSGYSLKLPAEERALLRTLPRQLQELIREGGDPSLVRLFPPAYADDAELEAEFRHYMRDDLQEGHLGALAVMEETLDADRLTEDQLAAWMRALNQLRLVLGTRLDVTEDLEDVDAEDPRAPALALYHYLGWLQEQVIQVARLA